MSESDTITKLDLLLAKGQPTPQAFQKFVLGYFKKNGRDFPWRDTRDPYRILVSEVMLQQTQTERVVVKYAEFLKAFPTWKALSQATPAEVVRVWMGLGYYRRAFNLHKAAQCVVHEHGGAPPQTAEGLRKLPGVGSYTAAAIAAFAFGEPAPMIETNIRAVYLYTFFPQVCEVSDKEILQKVEETLYKRDPRSWFYALMDLGVELKRRTKGINQRSKHHVKQSKFEGSQRQVRAAVLKVIAEAESLRRADISRKLSYDGDKIDAAIRALESEGLIESVRGGRLLIASRAVKNDFLLRIPIG
jgi:A/G-specific adenine glycosylase